MPEFAQRQKQYQRSRLVSPAKPDRATLQPVHAASPLLAQQQALGNQVAQRFAQSCPLALPSPSVCPFGGVCHTCPAQVQTKLTINQPGDKYEQEADRVAEQVMRMPEPYTHDEAAVSERSRGIHIQRACMECDEELRRQPLDEEEEEEILQAKEAPGCTPQVTPDLAGQINSLRGRGRPLPESARAFFEPRYGYDFGQVRVHVDAQAAELARVANARAFTIGRDIVFGAGCYCSGTAAGRRLLAHELTHTIQQEDASTTRIQRQCNQNELDMITGARNEGLRLTGGSARQLSVLTGQHDQGVVESPDRNTTACALLMNFNLDVRRPSDRGRIHSIHGTLVGTIDNLRARRQPAYICERPGSPTFANCATTEAGETQAFVVPGEWAVHFCPPFLDSYDPCQRAISVIHEYSHLRGPSLPGQSEIYAIFRGLRPTRPCPGALMFSYNQLDDLIDNADSYASLAASIIPCNVP